MKQVLFIIPAYNEEKNISKVIDDIQVNSNYADILIVNDCSKDNTLRVLKDADIDYLNLPINLGYSGALQAGFKYAVMNDYRYIIQFDGDGQHLASEANKLYEKITSCDADIVIGSRFLELTEYNHSFLKKIGTKLFSFSIKLTTHATITDPTSGLQILNSKVFQRYSKINRYPQYPDANLIVEMLLDGFNICEIPCIMKERLEGVSMHAGILNPIKYMVKTIYSLVLLLFKSIIHSIRKRG